MLAFICCVFFIYLFILFVSLTEERATCVLSSLVERNQELSLQSRLLSNYNLDYFLLLLFLFDDFPDELLPIIVLNLANIFWTKFYILLVYKIFFIYLVPSPERTTFLFHQTTNFNRSFLVHTNFWWAKCIYFFIFFFTFFKHFFPLYNFVHICPKRSFA